MYTVRIPILIHMYMYTYMNAYINTYIFLCGSARTRTLSQLVMGAQLQEAEHIAKEDRGTIQKILRCSV